MLFQSIESLNGISGLRNTWIIVAMKEALGITASYLLHVLDETSKVSASSPLRRMAALARQKVEQAPTNSPASGEWLLWIWPENRVDPQ